MSNSLASKDGKWVEDILPLPNADDLEAFKRDVFLVIESPHGCDITEFSPAEYEKLQTARRRLGRHLDNDDIEKIIGRPPFHKRQPGTE